MKIVASISSFFLPVHAYILFILRIKKSLLNYFHAHGKYMVRGDIIKKSMKAPSKAFMKDTKAPRKDC